MNLMQKYVCHADVRQRSPLISLALYTGYARLLEPTGCRVHYLLRRRVHYPSHEQDASRGIVLNEKYKRMIGAKNRRRSGGPR